MKSTKFMTFILIALSISCSGIDFSDGTPHCLKESIKQFKKSPLCKDASVDEYTFQGVTVFLLGTGNCCCDRSSAVIDYECNQIGFLGGITGNRIINGEEFSNATFIRTIWEK